MDMIYYPKDLQYILDNQIDFQIVQIPYSVFDRRFETFFPLLKEKEVEIHVRSVFLQGLVFKNPNELENPFVKIKEKLEKLNKLSEEYNISIAALCLNFAVLNQYIDKVVIGVDNLANLKENIDSVNDFERHLGKVEKSVTNLKKDLSTLKEEDENIILPINWVKG